jgi:transposase
MLFTLGEPLLFIAFTRDLCAAYLFLLLVNRKSKAGLLKKWLKQAVATGIKELKSFAKGLISEFEAVKNAVTMPWSNGQVERQINKLKTIKRQMYGQASFELLRKRLLLNSS